MSDSSLSTFIGTPAHLIFLHRVILDFMHLSKPVMWHLASHVTATQGMKSWRFRLIASVNVHIKNQNGEEM